MLNQSGSMFIKVGNDIIANTGKARNLGVTFDKHLNNTDHINNLSSTLFLSAEILQEFGIFWTMTQPK